MQREVAPLVRHPSPPDEFVDEFIDSWVCWREACEDVQRAYERWGKCTTSQRVLAFASYRAALDREDQAARVYSVWTERLGAARNSDEVIAQVT